MIKPNWDIFKAKFNANPHTNFEWLCYLLFCKQFSQEYGIFRYFNQVAIETNPICVGDEVIGFQAKFYDSTLSNHKDELLATVQKAKSDYPEITKLLIYTNQEWAQTKGRKPAGLVAIENQAEQLNIQLEWKTASFFESEFVASQNERIAKHFFTMDSSIFDLIEEHKTHAEKILNWIKTSISFNQHCHEIDRSEKLNQLRDAEQKICIISGDAGTGKTALVKQLYDEVKDEIPFVVFKASEFELRHINDMFAKYSIDEFVAAYNDAGYKIAVIDSSEKLLDLNNDNPFKEFLATLIQENWKIIFTIRSSYLDDLRFRFIEDMDTSRLDININNIDMKELSEIFQKNSLVLPTDENLSELIKNPSYLSKYLSSYSTDEVLDYSGFKGRLWKLHIVKSNPEREQCFLNVAFERANTGKFFVLPNGMQNNLCDEFVTDGILGYATGGYFITHDIYEEWALEKIIEREFINRDNIQSFFDNIGQSLPIRRCFRNWVSEKLLLEDSDIKNFISEVIASSKIDKFWQDEVLIAVLLSDYSEVFINQFRNDLLSDDCALLKTLTRFLRVCCKEVDNELFKQFGISASAYFLSKPKGRGWESIIKFVFENIQTIGIQNIGFILPAIYDWNSKIKNGNTTKYASLIALQYYQWCMENDVYISGKNSHLLQTILYGASEINAELSNVIDQIIANKWKNHGRPYYELTKMILSTIEHVSIIDTIPTHVLRLADLFWSQSKEEKNALLTADMFNLPSTDLEDNFGIECGHFDYYPVSALQTPIYRLLCVSLRDTIDFIIDFTNRSINTYATSRTDSSIQQVEIILSDGYKQRQYINNSLWNLYRGTGSSAVPNLIQSIHMALEKYLLEVGKDWDNMKLEECLIDMLQRSKSASISAVVTSIVLAYPEKTFNVAKILFKTKEFFYHDTTRRYICERHATSSYSMVYSSDNIWHEICKQERIQTCENKHRQICLENLCLYFQFRANNEVNGDEVTNRRNVIWKILDDYRDELPVDVEQSEADVSWGIYLARMDSRNMEISKKQTNEGTNIQLHTKFDPRLKKFSERVAAQYSEDNKYLSLKIWAEYKFEDNPEYKKYEQYENNPQLALSEVKIIVKELDKIITSNIDSPQRNEFEETFSLYYDSTPSYVCSVLLRDYHDQLKSDEVIFCKDVILKFATLPISAGYQHQISDGVAPAIFSMTYLLKILPNEREKIIHILLLNLICNGEVDFAISTTKNLWSVNFNDAQSILLGYLLLKPKYDHLRKLAQNESYQKKTYIVDENKVIDVFRNECQQQFSDVVSNNISISDLSDIENSDLLILVNALRMLPSKIESIDHVRFAKSAVSIVVKKLMLDKKEVNINEDVKYNFLESYAYLVLGSPVQMVEEYLQPFIDNFDTHRFIDDLLKHFIFAENILHSYDNFWLVWNTFKKYIINIYSDDKFWPIHNIVQSYLFATVPWPQSIKEWRSFRDENKRFFAEVSDAIGHCPAVLYAISKLLNTIGSNYIDDGICWISGIIKNNPTLVNKKLETNTIYYLENLTRRYIYNNRQKIREQVAVKNQLLTILDFLVKKESAIAYMLRESIL